MIVPTNNSHDIFKNNNNFELIIKTIFDKAHEVSEAVCKFKNCSFINIFLNHCLNLNNDSFVF